MNNIESEAGTKEVTALRRRINRQYNLGRMSREDWQYLSSQTEHILRRLREMRARSEEKK